MKQLILKPKMNTDTPESPARCVQPAGYGPLEFAHPDTCLTVCWHDESGTEYGTALYIAGDPRTAQLYKRVFNNIHADKRPCATPTGVWVGYNAPALAQSGGEKTKPKESNS